MRLLDEKDRAIVLLGLGPKRSNPPGIRRITFRKMATNLVRIRRDCETLLGEFLSDMPQFLHRSQFDLTNPFASDVEGLTLFF